MAWEEKKQEVSKNFASSVPQNVAEASVRVGRASIVAHAVTPHLRAHSILAQIVENGSSYPLCACHNIFSPVVSLFFFFFRK
jgi:hypothetical protein